MKIMRRNPTDAELEILRVLWSRGPCTVKQIHESLFSRPPRGYTTILKLLQIMSEKGLVRRDEKQRAHIYEACFSQEQTQKKLVGDLLDKAFSGSASKMVMQALSTRSASPSELREIRRLLDKMEGKSK
jgi:BlaI family penicillinase repressor